MEFDLQLVQGVRESLRKHIQVWDDIGITDDVEVQLAPRTRRTTPMVMFPCITDLEQLEDPCPRGQGVWEDQEGCW